MRRKYNKIPKLHIKKGDIVKVLSGKDKGAIGEVLKVFPKQQRAIVESVRIVKKHIKPRSPQEKGRVVEMEAPVHVSKLMLIDPKTKEPTRIGRVRIDGKWKRYAKKRMKKELEALNKDAQWKDRPLEERIEEAKRRAAID